MNQPPPPTKLNPDFLTQKICQTFKLFLGFRSEKDDEAILTWATDHCLREMLTFLKENLAAADLTQLSNELTTSSIIPTTENDRQKILQDTLSRYLETIPSGPFRLASRLDHLIHQLAYQAAQSSPQPQ